MFVGREKELKVLNDMITSNRFEMPIIYGRRRIGKTTLIKEFVKDKRVIFFTATQAREIDNLMQLTEAIRQLDGAIKIRGELRDFRQAFEIVGEIARESNEPLVFVIDEYPYLANADASISSILQSVIDHIYLELPNLMLILSGSSMSFMEKQVLGYESPLYGRRTGQLKIERLTPWEARMFFPQMNKEEFLTIYGMTAGIPLYLAMMSDKLSLKENIIENFFTTNTFLFEEPDNFLKQELKNPMNYHSIIKAIADGSSKFNTIATKTKMAPSSLDGNLSDLIELGIIEKKWPLGNTNKNAAIYRIADGLFAFWYSFVPSNMVLIESDKQELIWQSMQEKLTMFTSKVFEEFCVSWLKQKNGEGLFTMIISEIGQWWGKDPNLHQSTSVEHEIDILAFGQDKREVLIGECKWRKDAIGVDVLEQLLERATFFNRPQQEYFLFSKSGFTKQCENRASEERVHLVKFDEMI